MSRWFVAGPSEELVPALKVTSLSGELLTSPRPSGVSEADGTMANVNFWFNSPALLQAVVRILLTKSSIKHRWWSCGTASSTIIRELKRFVWMCLSFAVSPAHSGPHAALKMVRIAVFNGEPGEVLCLQRSIFLAVD